MGIRRWDNRIGLVAAAVLGALPGPAPAQTSRPAGVESRTSPGLRYHISSYGPFGSTRAVAASQPDLQALAAIDDHQWQTLFTVHRGSEAIGYVLGPDDRWLQVGAPLAVCMFAKRIELKMLYGLPGFKVDVECDDPRLYPLPADAPVRVAVMTADSRDSRRTWPMTVRIVSNDGKGPGRVLGERAGGPGGDLYDVTLPSDMVYPVAAKVQLFHGGRLDAEFPIERNGVAGLYPGDIRCIEAARPWVATIVPLHARRSLVARGSSESGPGPSFESRPR